MMITRTVAALTLSAAVALVPAGTASAAEIPDLLPLVAGSQPEGIAVGPGTTFFAGSRADGTIYQVDTRTGVRTVLAQGTPGHAARGLQVDHSTRLLWVAGDVLNADGTTTTSTVTAYDVRSGRQVQRYVVPGQRFLNDVQVTASGVYVTDSRNSELVVVRDGAFRLLPLTGDFPAPRGDNAANGIRELPGGALIITDSGTGDLFKVDPQTGVADRIELTGPDLTSGDGLALKGRTLYVVYGFSTNAVAVVQIDRSGRTGTVTGSVADPDLDRPTTAVLIRGSLYAVNGRFSVPPTPTTPYDVVRVAL